MLQLDMELVLQAEENGADRILVEEEAVLLHAGKRDDASILQNREILHDSVLFPVFRDIADTEIHCLGGGFHPYFPAIHENAPLVWSPCAEHRLENLAPPVAKQSGETDDLPAAYGKGNGGKRPSIAEILGGKDDVSSRAFPTPSLDDSVADHAGGKVRCRHVMHLSRRDHVSVPKNGIVVADLHHLVELVTDENDPHPLGAQAAHQGKHTPDLGPSEARGGLVHDDELRVHEQRPGDLDNLFIGSVKRPHHRAGIKVQTHAGEDFPRPGDHGFVVKETIFLLDFPSYEQVFVDGKVIDQVEFLVDECDAAVQRFLRVLEMHLVPVDDDLSCVGLEDAPQNVHQRAFPCAILAEERFDAPPAH